MSYLQLIHALLTAEGDDDPSSDPTVPKGKFDEVVKQRDSLKSDLRETRAKLEDLEKTALTAEELEAFRKYQEQLDKPEDHQAEIEEMRKKEREKYQTELDKQKAESDTSITALNREIDKLTIDKEIELEAVRAGVQNTEDTDKVEQVVTLLRQRIKREPTDNGGYRIVCMGKDDEILYNDKAQEMSIGEYLGTFLKANSHFVTTGTGSGPRIGNRLTGQVGPGDLLERSPQDNLQTLYDKKGS